MIDQDFDPASYGVSVTGDVITDPNYHRAYTGAPHIEMDDPRLKKITRFRMISDPGFPFWDVSYIYGEMKDGRLCQVINPFYELPKKGWKKVLIDYGKKKGIYMKGLGIFNAIASLQ